MENRKWRLALVVDALNGGHLRFLDTATAKKEFTFLPMAWIATPKN
jgi:hypothetical protein